MAPSEAARLDLYNGLSELLGTERAETLMTYLPLTDSTETISRFDSLRADMLAMESRLNSRLDRLFLTLVGGLFTIIAAMIAILVAVL